MNPPNPEELDNLTGLIARKPFLEIFHNLLEQAKSSSGDRPLSLAYFDTDRFLLINEKFGHAGGDSLLVALANMVRLHADEQAIIGRYGGDEFAILFPNTEREQAFLTLEQIRHAVEQLTVTAPDGQEIRSVTISAGVASFPVDGRSVAELIRKADHALYRAKVAGRNQVRLALEERMVPKTAHFTAIQLERLSKLAAERGVSEADLLREAMDELLDKYGVNEIES
jgi:diguanylate cyclase (GGDEF)-like protein